MSLLGVLTVLLPDALTLSSGRCCEPNSPPAGDILVVFDGDLLVDVICAKMIGSNQILNSIGDS